MKTATDIDLDATGAASVLQEAFFDTPFADSLEPRPEAIDRAESEGYKPILRLSSSPVSEVWRCIDLSSKIDVVIKLIRQDALDTPKDAEALLLHESQVLGRLKGTGVTLPLRQVAAGWSSYLALPYINGDPLTTHCKTRSLGLHDRLRLFARCVDSVARIHERGVVHGDLKPEHLLIDIDAGETPVVIDFGLASQREYTSRAVSGGYQIGGTADYMAPELADPGCRPEATQDVYSLGVILSRLTDGLDLGAAQAMLDTLIQNATAPALSDRFPSAREMHNAMAPLLRLREDGTPPNDSAAAEPGWRSTKLLFGIGAGCVTGLATLLYSTMSDPIQGVVDDPSPRHTPDEPGEETQMASLLPGLIGRAQEDPAAALEEIAELDPAELDRWEVGHALVIAADETEEYHNERLDRYRP